MQKYVQNNVYLVWLGLTKTQTNDTTWSNGALLLFSRSSVNITDGEQICEAMVKNTWKGFNFINQSATWEEALDYCEKSHSSLLWMKDVNDLAAVEQWLHTVFGFWIGKDHPVSESNWKDDQPPELPFSNQCAVLNATDYKWSGESCFHKHPFICEEKILKI
uniref:C-type lectin domain-containing protein n=1 Tax=Amphiprion percula TaxID=161767 RepID=A0A3P8T9G6_AMPPE